VKVYGEKNRWHGQRETKFSKAVNPGIEQTAEEEAREFDYSREKKPHRIGPKMKKNQTPHPF